MTILLYSVGNEKGEAETTTPPTLNKRQNESGKSEKSYSISERHNRRLCKKKNLDSSIYGICRGKNKAHLQTRNRQEMREESDGLQRAE